MRKALGLEEEVFKTEKNRAEGGRTGGCDVTPGGQVGGYGS